MFCGDFTAGAGSADERAWAEAAGDSATAVGVLGGRTNLWSSELGRCSALASFAFLSASRCRFFAAATAARFRSRALS